MSFSTIDRWTKWNDFIPGPIQRIDNPWGTQELYVKRLDQLHSWATGNKYYKLKYHFYHVIDRGIRTIVSKGGMYSNHLAAFAEACHHFDLKCICLIRSYTNDVSNPSINHLKDLNAELNFLLPGEYESFTNEAANQFYSEAYFIPEGGGDEAGIRGAGEIIHEIEEANFDHIILPAGTFTTAIGLLENSRSSNIIIVPAWKGCTKHYVEDRLSFYHIESQAPLNIWPDYHFGGFAKYTPLLVEFMFDFFEKTNILTDPVYTGKMMFAIKDKMEQGYFKEKDKILCLHTGGLQGLTGMMKSDPVTWGKFDNLLIHSQLEHL